MTYQLSYPFGAVSGDTQIDAPNDVAISRTSLPTAQIGGDVVINELSIITRQNVKISLLDSFTDFNIDENVFSASIVGSVTIGDIGGAIEKWEIEGGETISLKVSMPNTQDVIVWRQDFIINKISRYEVDITNLTKKYTLFFSSKSFVSSTKKLIFKSYKQTNIRDAVISLFKEMSDNDLAIEDPKVTLTAPFVSTGIMPHKAIEALAQRACTKNKFFVFFERFIPVVGTYSTGEKFASSHYFGSYEKLIEDSNTGGVHTLYFNQNPEGRVEGTSIRISKLTYKENFNHLECMILGLYNTTITSIDPIKRTYNVEKFGYKNRDTGDFYDNKLLDELNIFNTYDNNKNEIPGRRLILSSINDTINRKNWLPNNVFGHLSKSMFKLEVDIQGATNPIGVGHVVNLVIPSAYDRQLALNSNTPLPDGYHSGKYFVSGVKHSLSGTTYVKRLELTRGSSPIDLNRLVPVPP
jgi:hypothetical protein